VTGNEVAEPERISETSRPVMGAIESPIIACPVASVRFSKPSNRPT
jgi:hypothetical protein